MADSCTRTARLIRGEGGSTALAIKCFRYFALHAMRRQKSLMMILFYLSNEVFHCVSNIGWCVLGELKQFVLRSQNEFGRLVWQLVLLSYFRANLVGNTPYNPSCQGAC